MGEDCSICSLDLALALVAFFVLSARGDLPGDPKPLGEPTEY